MFNKVSIILHRYGRRGLHVDGAKQSKNATDSKQEEIEDLFQSSSIFESLSRELCDKALMDAKSQLHALLRQVELEKLGQRPEFVKAFKQALEKTVAERIITWLPVVRAVYKFDPSRESGAKAWDNSIHLLLLVPQLLPSLHEFGLQLDSEMVKQLKGFNWSRFQNSNSVVEIQQVTRDEIRHGVCYGAMFYSFYTFPSQIWPPIVVKPN